MTSRVPAEIVRVAELGWHVYPASRHSRAACLRNPAQEASCSIVQIVSWTEKFPDCNWRVVFGPSGLWGLDCDVAGDGHAADGVVAMRELVARFGPLPPKPTLRSGGGGYAIFFRHEGEDIIGKTGTPAPGIDPRRGLLSQTIPPSRHHRTGQPYRWLVPPWEVAPPRAPTWLVRLCVPPPRPQWSGPFRGKPPVSSGHAHDRLARAASVVMHAGPGTRNDTLNRQAFAVARLVGAGLIGRFEAARTLYYAAQQTGLSGPEIEATLRSAFLQGMQRPLR